jgi:hypothetical protein
MKSRNIRIAQSCAADARQAVREFHAAVVQPDMELVVFFCSSEYDLDTLAAEMRILFAGIQVVGCTSAGEIGPAGYLTHSLSGMSFAAGSCAAVSGRLENLNCFDLTRGHEFSQALLQQLESKAPQANPDNGFALLLIDGMSIREEPVAHALQYELGKIALVGGSAGDDQKFVKTHVYSDGSFQTDSAVVILVSTDMPFKSFMCQHFIATHERVVVTKTDMARRMVMELNGLPAAEEYARLVGVRVKQLDSRTFSASPLVVVIDGTDYVRGIQKANDDGSLSFFCAIEEGVVLRVAHGVDMIDNLNRAFDDVRAEIGPPQLVFGCDCILRREEVALKGQMDRIGEIFRRNNTVGFSSYGEQFHGVHVNQTFTGIAIGTCPEPTRAPRDA